MRYNPIFMGFRAVLCAAILCLVSPSWAESPAPLEMTLGVGDATNEIAPDTPVDLGVTLTNVSEETVTIVHPDYWGVSVIRVHQQGSDTEVEPLMVKAERKKLAANWLVLEPGESADHVFVGMQHWTCCYRSSWSGFEAGAYAISLVVSSPPVKVEVPTDNSISWTGALEASIDIVVK